MSGAENVEERSSSEPPDGTSGIQHVASACAECDQNASAVAMYSFANAQLRKRVEDLEHGLALALELLDAHDNHDTIPAPPAVFSDEGEGGDSFGLLDPPIVGEFVPDPFHLGAAATASSGAAFESYATCGSECIDGSGRRCDLAPGHGGAHASMDDGLPAVQWGRSRV